MNLTPDQQRDSDLAELASATLAATTARSFARYYETLAENVVEDPALGAYAERAAIMLRRGYCAISLQLLSVAADAEGRRDSYLSLILGGVA